MPLYLKQTLQSNNGVASKRACSRIPFVENYSAFEFSYCSSVTLLRKEIN